MSGIDTFRARNQRVNYIFIAGLYMFFLHQDPADFLGDTVPGGIYLAVPFVVGITELSFQWHDFLSKKDRYGIDHPESRCTHFAALLVSTGQQILFSIWTISFAKDKEWAVEIFTTGLAVLLTRQMVGLGQDHLYKKDAQKRQLPWGKVLKSAAGASSLVTFYQLIGLVHLELVIHKDWQDPELFWGMHRSGMIIGTSGMVMLALQVYFIYSGCKKKTLGASQQAASGVELTPNSVAPLRGNTPSPAPDMHGDDVKTGGGHGSYGSADLGGGPGTMRSLAVV